MPQLKLNRIHLPIRIGQDRNRVYLSWAKGDCSCHLADSLLPWLAGDFDRLRSPLHHQGFDAALDGLSNRLRSTALSVQKVLRLTVDLQAEELARGYRGHP